MATGENRVRWDLLEPSVYEDMVAVLLSRLRPGVVRVDGKGGDGGRDCYFTDAEGTDVYELKSFSGRLTRSRRRQIKKSLRRASRHDPNSWTLVVPIDPTPKEGDWFADLQDEYGFPLAWNGRTWLDSEMARRPDIHRYFVDGAAEEVVERLVELQKEEAALAGGVSDAAARLGRVRNRLNEIDPFYEFSISVTPDEQSVALRPRYAGAERDRPVRGRIVGAFPNTDDGRALQTEFEEAIGYGLPFDLGTENIEVIEIDAPGGLGGTFNGGEISFLPIDTEVRLQLRFKVADPEGVLVGQLPIVMTKRTGGHKGVILGGTDKTGWLSVTMRFQHDGKLDISYRTSMEDTCGVLPADLGPPMSFLAVLHVPNELSVETLDPPAVLVDGMAIDSAPIIEAGHRKIIDELAELQRVSGVHFELPDVLSPEDMREIDEGSRLLAGEPIQLPWRSGKLTLTPSGEEPQVIREACENPDEVRSLRTNQMVGVAVDSNEMLLGMGWVSYPAVRITNSGDVLEQWDAGADKITLEIEYLEDPIMTLGEAIANGLPQGAAGEAD